MLCSFKDTNWIKLHVIYYSKERGDMRTSTFIRRPDRRDRKRAMMGQVQ